MPLQSSPYFCYSYYDVQHVILGVGDKTKSLSSQLSVIHGKIHYYSNYVCFIDGKLLTLEKSHLENFRHLKFNVNKALKNLVLVCIELVMGKWHYECFLGRDDEVCLT